MLTDFTSAMLDLYGHYQNQILPFSGGIYEQPNAFQQAMNILDGYIKREESDAMKQALKNHGK